MRQICGGVVSGVDDKHMNFFIHLSSGIKLRAKIQNKFTDVIFLIPNKITEEDLIRCETEYDLGKETLDKLKEKVKFREKYDHLNGFELKKYESEYIKGIYAIMFAIHYYFFRDAKKIVCQAWIGNELHKYSVEYS